MKLKKLKLTELSRRDLDRREMNRLIGGENCCICTCGGNNTALNTGNNEYSGNGVHETGGYGSGSFG
jgi:natural product precursor